MRDLPVVVIAGTASGVGKTSVATGLMAALTAAGHVVQGSKVGPDYIDPSHHAVATGRPPRNLDVWLSGAELIAPLARHGARGAALTIIEGVMGLFDGASPTEETASTAQVAKLLDAPVVLVVDAGAMARSAAAVVHGFATFDADLRLAGVLLNRVGSSGHADLLREAIAPTGIPVLGALPIDDSLASPSRHLGLVPVAEQRSAVRRLIARLGEWVGAHVDLGGFLQLARSAPLPDGAAWAPPPSRPARPVLIAAADGPAFSFRYTEHLELLEAAGATVAPFDPLVDAGLPDGTDALSLGGGFPEVHAAALAQNRPLMAAIARHAEVGRPIVGECGGLLYLCRSLDDIEQVGALPAVGRMTDELTIGYRRAVAATDSVLWRAGEVVHGHEFHRTATTPPAGRAPAWTIDGRPEGFVQQAIHASYLHTHWAATPHAAARLVAAAAAGSPTGRSAPSAG